MSAAEQSLPVTYNLADLFEFAVDQFGEREFIVADDKRATYLDLERRSNRLAHHLSRQGVGPGDHVGIYAFNCMEWVEAMYAILKIRAVFININYRYVHRELLHLFRESDIKALIYHRSLGDRLTSVAGEIPNLKHFLEIDDADDVPRLEVATAYEDALAAESDTRDFEPRSSDDHYILFTGGTTGLPKGVVWRHEDVFFALGGGIDATSGERVSSPSELILKAREKGGEGVFLNPAPLMHGACQWGVMGGALSLRKVILVRQFDADEIWQLVGREQVNALMITGDAMGRPLADLLAEKGDSYSLDSLFMLASTAAVFSPAVVRVFMEHLPKMIILDGVGASESGSTGMATLSDGDTKGLAHKSGGLKIRAGRDTAVLDDDLKPMAPGDDRIGRLARRGNIPVGYYKDPKKTAETFMVAADGHRYAVPGDFAKLDSEGNITLLGRGSICINSGGMKIYPEEVEQVVKGHPAVYDAVVVGIPSTRWGEQVAAVVQLRDKQTLDLEALQEHCRAHLARFKVPRSMTEVDQVLRSPSGKPDYRWAAECFSGASRSQASG